MAVRVHADSFEIGDGSEGCLLIHGLTGSPKEMKPLGQFLAGERFHVYGVRLAGHGTTVQDLMGTGWRDWRRSAQEALAHMIRQHRVVHIIGLSLGGLIALDLASDLEYGRVVALAAPYRLQNRYAELAAVLRFFIQTVSAADEPWFQDEMYSYRQMPVAGVHQLLVYRKWVLHHRISHLARPVLIIQGLQDKTVDPESAWLWAQKIRTSMRQIVMFEQSGHILPLDVDRHQVFMTCQRFLENWE